MNIIEVLNWRHASKRMNGTKVSSEKINEILEAIRLSASSFGLQPYRIIVIENEDVKKKLQAFSINPQISECSHLLIFAVIETITEKYIEEYINRIIKIRGVSPESLNPINNKLKTHFSNLSTEDSFNWSAKQAYIGLGTALIAASNLKVDSSPMEGFNPVGFDEVLELKEKGLKSVVLLGLGYRDEANDFLSKAKKVRLQKEELVIEIN